MADRGQRIRLGLFAVGAFVAIATLIIVFGKRPTWLETRTLYTVIFDNAPGILNGTPVRRSGVKIGEVDGLEIVESGENAGKVRVTLRISSKFLPRANETPSITQSLLTGDSAIDFVVTDVKQKPSSDPLPPGSVVSGRSPIDARASFEDVKTVIPTLQTALVKIGDTFERFNKVAPDAENFLREYALLSRALRETIPELQRTNDSLRMMVDDTRVAIPQFKQTNDQAQLAIKNWSNAGEQANLLLATNREKITTALDNLSKTLERANRLFTDENVNNVRDTLRNAKNASDKFEQTAQNIDQLSKDGTKTMARFNESLAKADKVIDNMTKATEPLGETTSDLQKLVAELRYVVQQFGQGHGTVQRLLTDPSLYNNANEVTYQLARMMPRLEQVMMNLEDFSDKLARHPEKLGLSGMFRPDSGLKKSPSAPTPWLQPR